SIHALQTAEKYLKAVLVEDGRSVPRTHNLEDLLGLLRPTYRHLVPLRRGLQFLVQFAVDIRYPGFQAIRRQAAAALRWAGRVRRHRAYPSRLTVPAPKRVRVAGSGTAGLAAPGPEIWPVFVEKMKFTSSRPVTVYFLSAGARALVNEKVC